MTGNPPDYNPPEPDIGAYILKYRKPVKCHSILQWGKWMQYNRRQVRRTYVGSQYVSTVFLGLDHSFNGGKPILFETMIFPDQDYQTRCCTWREALKMHWEAVEEVKGNDYKK